MKDSLNVASWSVRIEIFFFHFLKAKAGNFSVFELCLANLARMSTTSLCVVSDNERRFILDGVLANFRSDGRSRTELR